MIPALLISLLATGVAAQERFEVGLWVDHQDWASPSGGLPWDTVSPEGLEQIVDHCIAAGATTLYWRGFGGGLTVHNSKVEEGLYPQLVDKRRTSDPLYFNGGVRYGDCDPDIIGAVVQICHRKGIKCLLYWPWEDTHNLQCFLSQYTLEHPGLWDVRVDGYSAPGRLSLAFPEVRDYKLALAREFLELGVDGFFIDFRRQSNWTPEFGYVPLSLRGYEERVGHGPDPADEQWLRFRAAYQTRTLEQLRGLCNEAGRPVEIIAAPPLVTPDPMQPLADRFVDWPTWVDLGLIDGLAPDGLPFGDGASLEAIARDMDQVRGMIAGRCKLYWSIRTGYDWGNGLRTLGNKLGWTAEETLAEVIRLAWEHGAAGVQDDTFDPGLESPEWIATLRNSSAGAYRWVNENPSPPADVPAVRADYIPPPEPDAHDLPAPSALEDDAAPRRLTGAGSSDTEACVSPDGTWVAFQSDRGGKGVHIWRLELDGGEPRQLTSGNHNNLFPAISPDGAQIAFCSDRADGRFYHIYTMPATGGEPRQITRGGATDTLPAFTPDGESIVFTSTRDADLYRTSNVLYEVPVAGGEPVTLGMLKYAQMEPSISRDGTAMAFTALDDLEGVNFYCCVSPVGDPASRVRLTPPNESCYGPAISPDGRAIAYMSPGPDRRCGWDVWVREVYGSRIWRITNSPANDRSPAWSPDGRNIVFESSRDGAGYSLYSVDVSQLEFAAATGDGVWGQTGGTISGMIGDDTDPANTPMVWGTGIRPALDYNNRSFGVHLGRKRPVTSITVVNAMPRGECRIDQAHTEVYYGDRNGSFTRYTGPMTFSTERAGNAILIKLEGLEIEASIIKVHFAYDDGNYTAVATTPADALVIPDPTREKETETTRAWTVVQGRARLMPWHCPLGKWHGDGHTLSPTDISASDMRSGEGARAFLPIATEGDLSFSCQFQLPDNSSGAGGPVIYFGAQADGSLSAFRYISAWGTSVLQTKKPGQPWVEVGCSTGRNLDVTRWHTLELTSRDGLVTVRVDGTKIAESREKMPVSGAVGLGCQVRSANFRAINVEASSLRDAPDWSMAQETPGYVVVSDDAGRGGYQAFPGLCRLRSGDLLAVFYAGWQHVSSPGERGASGGAIAMSRSTDNGRTWGEARIVLDTPLDDRDPAVWQCDDGTVYVAAPTCDWSKYTPPYDDWCGAHTVRSDDDGVTWSQPAELPIGETRNFTVWTEPRRLSDGQWLWPMYLNHGETVAAVMRSTDGGHTWSKPRFLDPEATSTDEPDICQFPDGSLLCVMRPGPESHMWQSRSTDLGETWSKPAPLPFYGHSPALLHTSGGITLLAQRDPGTTVRYSLDEGKTWAGAAMIDPCGGAYPQMVELPDGRVLIVYYTEGSRSEIRAQFLRVDASGIRVVAP